MSTCHVCGAPDASPTSGCPHCLATQRRDVTASAESIAVAAAHNISGASSGMGSHAYPPYDIEGLPDARHDESGAIYNTGKVRAIKPSQSQPGMTTGGHRPPVLASEALAEDLRPLEPGLLAARWIDIGCGAGTLGLGVATLGISSSAGLSVAAIGATLIALALTPLPYALRATVQVALATALLAGSTVASVLSHGQADPGIALPVVVLSTGLLFRSWHRASRHARMVVATGIVLAALWLGWSEHVNVIFGASPHWQAMVLAITRLALAPVLLISLLAFMNETTTGGCGAWAATVLIWYGVDCLLGTLVMAWPPDMAAFSWRAMLQGQATANLLSALAAPVLAVGCAQLMVVATSDTQPSRLDQRPT